MKNFIRNIPVKLRMLGLFSAVCLFLTGIIIICENHMVRKSYDQQMAERWAKEGAASQISVFYTKDAVQDVNDFRGIEQAVDKALQAASIVSENENARLWISAAGRGGKVVLSTKRAMVELNAVGVSGEFFQFHPQKIVSGSIFSADNLMRDGIVIDEDTAWQLFGSSDVAGMQVMLGEVPHYISGVIQRPKGRLEKAAGLEKTMCFLSMESLENYGTVTGGFTYEIVLPDPIKNFAVSTIQTAVGMENENAMVVENSTRFGWMSLLNVIRNFGTRSMRLGGFSYPYWENIARGQEDVLALLLLLKCLLLVLPCTFVWMFTRYLWKRKTWTLGQGITWMQDKVYEAGTRRVQRKNRE